MPSVIIHLLRTVLFILYMKSAPKKSRSSMSVKKCLPVSTLQALEYEGAVGVLARAISSSSDKINFEEARSIAMKTYADLSMIGVLNLIKSIERHDFSPCIDVSRENQSPIGFSKNLHGKDAENLNFAMTAVLEIRDAGDRKDWNELCTLINGLREFADRLPTVRDIQVCAAISAADAINYFSVAHMVELLVHSEKWLAETVSRFPDDVDMQIQLTKGCLASRLHGELYCHSPLPSA
jgi:hypothetical protein